MESLRKKALKKLRLVFYLALIIIIVTGTTVFFKNKNKLNLNKKIKIAVRSDLIFKNFKNINRFTELKPKIDKLKNLNVSNIIFKKKVLNDYVINGDLTVKNGYELINMFKSHSIVNPYVFKQLKHKKIVPEFSYIMLHDQELFVKLLPILNKILYPVKVKVYRDEKFKYDGDISNNYIIEISCLKNKYYNSKLFYPERLIEFMNDSGFEITLLNPDKNDMFFDYHIFGLFTGIKINFKQFKSISHKLFTLVVNNDNYYKYSDKNKIKYLAVTSQLIRRNDILEKFMTLNHYNFLVYSPLNITEQENLTELKYLNNLLEKTGYQYPHKLQLKELLRINSFIYPVVILLLLVFYIIVYLDCEKLLFSGFIGITLAYILYFTRLYSGIDKTLILITGILQILSIQTFFVVIRKKNIINIFKGFMLVIVLMYSSVVICSDLVFYLLTMEELFKNIIVLPIVLSFLFGLYFYRKSFENKLVFNFIQILLFISIVIILFRIEFGYQNLFSGFYNKLIKGMLISIL